MNVGTDATVQHSEEQIIERARAAVSQSNWVVGECAAAWTTQYARGRTDAEFGIMVGLSGDQVRQRRRVWDAFGHGKSDTYPNLKWSFFYAAMGWDDAEVCLKWADDNEATVAEMRAWRRAQNGEDLFADAGESRNEWGAPTAAANLDGSDVPDARPDPIIKPQNTQRREGGQSGRVTVPESRNTAEARRDSRASAESGKADRAAVSGTQRNSSVGKTDSVEPPITTAEIQRLLDRFDAAAADRRQQARLYFDRAVKLDPSLKPKIPTVSQLVDAMPAGMPEGLAAAAIDWAEYKQSLTGKDRIRSIKAWQTACRQMKKYPEDVVCEAVETAIANGWTGWLQDSVKRDAAFGGKAPVTKSQQRAADNQAAFDDVFGSAGIEESDVPY